MIISKIKKILLSFIFHTKNIWYIMCFSWFFHMYELIVAFKKFTIWKHIFYSFSKHSIFNLSLFTKKIGLKSKSIVLFMIRSKQYWHFFIIHYNYVPRYLLKHNFSTRFDILLFNKEIGYKSLQASYIFLLLQNITLLSCLNLLLSCWSLLFFHLHTLIIPIFFYIILRYSKAKTNGR